MGTCTRCGTARGAGDRCQFCGRPYAAAAPAVPSQAPPAEASPPVPAYQPAATYQPVTAYQPPGDYAVTVAVLTPPPAKPTGNSDASTIGLSVAAVLGPYMLACVVLTALMATSIGGDHAGSPADWLRGGIVVAALGLRGSAFASFDGSALSATMHLTATPLLLLGCVLVLTWYVGRRAEREAPSRDEAHATARAALSALGVVAGLAVLALVSRSSGGFGLDAVLGGQATHGAALRPMLFALPVLAVAFGVARRDAWRQANGLTSVREELAFRTQGISEHVVPTLQHLAGSAVLLGAVLLVVAVATGEDVPGDLARPFDGNAVAGGVALLFGLPNVAVAAVALLLGMSAHRGGGGPFGGQDSSFGLLHGDFDGSDYLYLLIPLAVGLVLSVRRAQAGRVGGWWQAGVASVLVWLALWHLTLMRFTVEGDGESVSASIGLGVLGLLVASFLWGAGLQVAGQLLGTPRDALERGWHPAVRETAS
ncbi:MAG: hypothetical protein JWN87_1891 [Frankiales bacterium]|nr:hypothetical protein [Frankiales bacterium]